MCRTERGSEASFSEAQRKRLRETVEKKTRSGVECDRCGEMMRFKGAARLEWGTASIIQQKGSARWSALDVYQCDSCGKLEFFRDGVGEETRNENLEL